MVKSAGKKTAGKILKIIGIILGTVIGLVVLIALSVFLYSKLAGAKKAVQNPVYDTGNTWTYLARFYDAQHRLQKEDTLEMVTNDARFFVSQNKITWWLHRGKEKTWSVTGLIEDPDRIWLHPPRFDGYYEFTEFASFPCVRFPAVVGKTWSTKLSLGSYATEQTGPSLKEAYEITAIDTVSFAPLSRVITVQGTGTCKLGVYQHQMTYTDSAGFTQFEYTKQNGEKLIMALASKTPGEASYD